MASSFVTAHSSCFLHAALGLGASAGHGGFGGAAVADATADAVTAAVVGGPASTGGEGVFPHAITKTSVAATRIAASVAHDGPELSS